MDLDWNQIGKVASSLAPLLGFILFNLLFRKQTEQRRRLAVVKSLLSEIVYNQRLVESVLLQYKIKKFKTSTWKRNKGKMDYIDQGLRSILANAYDIAEEFNKEMDKAKKYKSSSYFNTSRLIEPLVKSKRGLEQWLELNKDIKKASPPLSI